MPPGPSHNNGSLFFLMNVTQQLSLLSCINTTQKFILNHTAELPHIWKGHGIQTAELCHVSCPNGCMCSGGGSAVTAEYSSVGLTVPSQLSCWPWKHTLLYGTVPWLCSGSSKKMLPKGRGKEEEMKMKCEVFNAVCFHLTPVFPMRPVCLVIFIECPRDILVVIYTHSPIMT